MFSNWFRKYRFYAISAICLLLLVNLARILPRTHFFTSVVQAQSVPVLPYTVSLTETTTGIPGLALAKKITKAVRVDGSEVTVESGTFTHEQRNEKMPYTRRQLMLTPGLRAFVYDDLQVKSTTKLSSQHFDVWRGGHRDSSRNCVYAFNGQKIAHPKFEENVSSQETLNGLRTVKVHMPKFASLTVWFALDYGCEVVGQRAIFPESVDEKWVERVQAGSPDPKLFDISASYEEVPPSELDKRSFARYGMYESGTKIPQQMFSDWQQHDARYFGNRP